MNIGIDVDNVISNFNDGLLEEYLAHDKELRGSGIIDKSGVYIRNGMFDWSHDEELKFYKENIEKIAKKLGLIEGAKEYINKLHEDGHFICIITGRDNGEYKNPYNMTKTWLDKHDIYYDKLILTNAYDKHEKSLKCKNNNIDIMIDDSVHICEDCFNSGIEVLLMDNPYNRYEKNLKRISGWKQIYEYISNYKKSKYNVILDTDIGNECDDQFAVSYMIKNQDIFNIEAITLAPHSHRSIRKVTIQEGMKCGYDQMLKICNWLNFNTEGKIFKGAQEYMSNGNEEYNEATEKIIEIALKNEKTYILAIGAITNVALAIKKEPKIIDKIEVIWLGGNELGDKDNFEYNFRQDVKAVKTVFESKVKLTVLPCENVVSDLRIDVNTLKKNLENKSELCNYLIEKFCNDGYHEFQESRVIWDISVIAYMINKKWFTRKMLSCPNIKDDTSYEMTNDSHSVTFIKKLDRDNIYKDLFKKLTE